MNQMEPGNACQSRETSPGTLPGTRRNQEMMMEQNAKRLGGQTPEPYPEPMEPRIHDGTKFRKSRETSPEPYLEPEN